MSGWQAGWREITELNLTSADVAALETDIERDPLQRIRISFESRLLPVQQAKDILGYRKTVDAEETRLLPAIDSLLCPVLHQIREGLFYGAVLLGGLAEMIDAFASNVETGRNLLVSDPTNLVNAPSAAAAVILDAVGVKVPADYLAVLASLGLQDLMPRETIPFLTPDARAVASELGLDRVAKLLGRAVVTCVGAAWAVNRRLLVAGVGISTDEGARYLSEAFWNRIGIPRTEVDATWRRIMIEEFEPQDEKEQLGLLLWSWPEVI
jgi:hypothetical protein